MIIVVCLDTPHKVLFKTGSWTKNSRKISEKVVFDWEMREQINDLAFGMNYAIDIINRKFII